MHRQLTAAAPSGRAAAPASIDQRVGAFDSRGLAAALESDGCAVLNRVLRPEECAAIAALYGADARFRSRVVMAKHGFGSGEYKYFAYPLPEAVARLREALYPPLAAIANRWNERLRVETRYPESLAGYLERCRRAGQTRPTPLLLRYGPGDYNCLHQDVYGEHVFPLQVAFLLSAPGRDFSGGEFVLTEQRPRRQSRAEWCRSRRVTVSSSRFASAPSKASEASTGSSFGTASAACGRGSG